MRFLRFAVSFAVTIAFATTAFASETFTKKSFPTGSAISTVAADINRDGHPDVISANKTSNGGYLEVLLGSSSGFITGGTFAITGSPQVIVAGDFNNDGYPDVLVLLQKGLQLFVSAKNGALVPRTPVTFDCDNCVSNNLVAADLNLDHVPDIAYTICSTTISDCGLFVDSNDKTGHFTGSQVTGLDAHAGPHSLVAADFNRDGIDDLAVATDKNVQIFRSLGDVEFVPLQTIASPLGTPLGTPAAGDIDAKNGPDLVFTASPKCFPDCIQSPTIYVYLNNGSGTLSRHESFTPAGESALDQSALIDITGDNRLDLIAMNGALQENNGSVAWSHYAGSGTFSGTFSTITQLGGPMQLIGRDLNLDSRHDLIVADPGVPFTTPGTVVLTNTTSNAAICTPPSSANLAAKLCSPTSTTSSRTFTVKAAGNSPSGVRRIELWIDGTKKYNSPDDRLEAVVTLSSGTHKFEIVAVDQFGSVAKTSKSISVP